MVVKEYLELLKRFPQDSELVTLDYRGRPIPADKPQEAFVHPVPGLRTSWSNEPWEENTKKVVLT